MDVEEPIDLDRVISDLKYRRDVIDYLNRRAMGAPLQSSENSYLGTADGFTAPVRPFDSRLSIVQDKP